MSLWMVEFGHFIGCLWSGCRLITVSPVSDAGHYDHISQVAGELCVLVRRACRFLGNICVPWLVAMEHVTNLEEERWV